ncbi:unnamed protein product [Parajaminaea phylloscopi]
MPRAAPAGAATPGVARKQGKKKGGTKKVGKKAAAKTSKTANTAPAEPDEPDEAETDEPVTDKPVTGKVKTAAQQKADLQRSEKQKLHHEEQLAFLAQSGSPDKLEEFLNGMYQSGLGWKGQGGWDHLSKWEASTTVDSTVVKIWPRGPLGHFTLVNTMRHWAEGKPYTLSSWWRRWAMGITANCWGTLEDVRWILFESMDEEWEGPTIPDEKEIIHPPERANFPDKVSKNPDAPRRNLSIDTKGDYVFTDRLLCGPPTARPITSGGVFVACWVAVASLHSIYFHRGLKVDKLSQNHVSERDWAEVIQHLTLICKPFCDLRDAWSPRHERTRDSHDIMVWEGCRELVKFVWKVITFSPRGKSHGSDKNIAHLWEVTKMRLRHDESYMQHLWARLPTVATSDSGSAASELPSFAPTPARAPSPQAESDMAIYPLSVAIAAVEQASQAATEPVAAANQFAVAAEEQASQAATEPVAAANQFAVAAEEQASQAATEPVAAANQFAVAAEEQASQAATEPVAAANKSLVDPHVPTDPDGDVEMQPDPAVPEQSAAVTPSKETASEPVVGAAEPKDTDMAADISDADSVVEVPDSTDSEDLVMQDLFPPAKQATTVALTSVGKARQAELGSLPKSQGEISEFLRRGLELPRKQPGTGLAFAELPASSNAELKDIRSRMGNVSPAIDLTILGRAKFVPKSATAQVDSSEAENESGALISSDAAGSKAIETIQWITRWAGLSREELQKRLMFWVLWAQRHGKGVPTQARASVIEALLEEVRTAQAPFRLEEFLGCRQHAAILRASKGMSSLVSSGFRQEKFQFTNHQLVGALFFIHKALARTCPGCQDQGCIIGDSMGVGKTNSGLIYARLADKLGLFGRRPNILMASRKLLPQWLASFYSIFDCSYKGCNDDGTRGSSNKIDSSFKAVPWYVLNKPTWRQDYGSHCLLLVSSADSYNTREIKEGRFGMLIFDEAHQMLQVNEKDSLDDPQKYLLAAGADEVMFKVLLTGTPVTSKLDHQYTLLRSAGSSHFDRDKTRPPAHSEWWAVEKAGKEVSSMHEDMEKPLLELAAASDELLECATAYVADPNPAACQRLKDAFAVVQTHIDAVLNVAVGYGRGQARFQRLFLPFWKARNPISLPLPVAEAQPIIIRRFADPQDLTFKPHAFIVRVEPTPEFQSFQKATIEFLKESARALENTTVSEGTHRLAAAHPALALDPPTFRQTRRHLEKAGISHDDYVRIVKDIAGIEEQLMGANLPLKYKPTRRQLGRDLSRQESANYTNLADLRKKRSIHDALTAIKHMNLPQGQPLEVGNQIMLAEMPSPLGSMLMALLKACFAAAQGAKLPASLRNRLPPKRAAKLKVLIFVTNYKTVAFVQHLLVCHGPYASTQLVDCDSTQGAKRIASWESDEGNDILIITRKQTVGLNLQRASVLIMWDTPSDEATQYQAFGRVARMGQTIDPYIYMLEVAGSYNDRAKELQRVKSALTSSVDRVAAGNATIDLSDLVAESLRTALQHPVVQGGLGPLADALTSSAMENRLRAISTEQVEKEQAKTNKRLQNVETKIRRLENNITDLSAAVKKSQAALDKARAEARSRQDTLLQADPEEADEARTAWTAAEKVLTAAQAKATKDQALLAGKEADLKKAKEKEQELAGSDEGSDTDNDGDVVEVSPEQPWAGEV